MGTAEKEGLKHRSALEALDISSAQREMDYDDDSVFQSPTHGGGEDALDALEKDHKKGQQQQLLSSITEDEVEYPSRESTKKSASVEEK